MFGVGVLVAMLELRYCELVLIPTLSFGCETLAWPEYDKSRVRTVDMEMLRSVFTGRRIDRIRNTEVRGGCGVLKSFGQREEKYFEAVWSCGNNG